MNWSTAGSRVARGFVVPVTPRADMVPDVPVPARVNGQVDQKSTEPGDAISVRSSNRTRTPNRVPRSFSKISTGSETERYG